LYILRTARHRCQECERVVYLTMNFAGLGLQLWSVQQKENAGPTVKFVADLSYHSKAVNVLRFSPSGLHFSTYFVECHRGNLHI
jgi:hypothetical protein